MPVARWPTLAPHLGSPTLWARAVVVVEMLLQRLPRYLLLRRTCPHDLRALVLTVLAGRDRAVSNLAPVRQT